MSLVQCSNVIKNFQMGKVQVEILRGVSLNIEKDVSSKLPLALYNKS